MERKYADFIPFIDERAWWANEADLGNRDCSCSRCGREFVEAGMDEVTELCWECAAEVAGAQIVVIESNECPFYDGPQADVWHAASARDGRFEARLARGG